MANSRAIVDSLVEAREVEFALVSTINIAARAISAQGGANV